MTIIRYLFLEDHASILLYFSIMGRPNVDHVASPPLDRFFKNRIIGSNSVKL